MKMGIKYLSLFSGIGGFELGIQQAYENNKSREQESIGSGTERNGIQQSGDSSNINSSGEKSKQEQRHRLGERICIGYSEIDKYAIQIYEKHFQHKNFGDITKINAEELPDFDMLCGGFPCQAFSIAGKRKGFEDTRGTLFFEIARICKAKRPRLLLLENVKGLLSHDNGQTFRTILSTLDELGYDLQWQVLNSKNFGVPQNRERVFIIGHLRGERRPQVFPIGAGNTKDIEQLNAPKHSNDRVYGEDGLSPTLNTMQGGRRQPFVVAQRGRYPANPKARIVGLPTEQMLEPNLKGISNTLSTVQKDNMLCENSKIRRLTPTECERLQGFPDGWTEGISDSQRYKCLGNAVTVNVIREIMSRLISNPDNNYE